MITTFTAPQSGKQFFGKVERDQKDFVATIKNEASAVVFKGRHPHLARAITKMHFWFVANKHDL